MEPSGRPERMVKKRSSAVPAMVSTRREIWCSARPNEAVDGVLDGEAVVDSKQHADPSRQQGDRRRPSAPGEATEGSLAHRHHWSPPWRSISIGRVIPLKRSATITGGATVREPSPHQLWRTAAISSPDPGSAPGAWRTRCCSALPARRRRPAATAVRVPIRCEMHTAERPFDELPRSVLRRIGHDYHNGRLTFFSRNA
jgi:hypothetical protein